MALLGKQFMFFFFFFFFLLFLSTQARNSQYFAQQVRQQNTNSKEHDDQENKFQPSFYKDTTTSYPHGIGAAATTPPPPPPLPDKPENLPSNYDANSYTTRAQHSTVNQQYQTNSQDKTVSGYKPYGKQVSEKYQQYYDRNSDVADKSKTKYFPENNEQHNSYNKKKPVEEEEEEEDNTEDEEEEPAAKWRPTTVAEKYTPKSTRNQHADKFYHKDMNTESNEDHENNKKKKNDESGKYQFYTKNEHKNVFGKDEELEKYLAEEEDNNVSPQEDEDTTTKYNPNPNYNPYQNPNYNPYQTPPNSENPFGEPQGMSDTRLNEAATHYDTNADKFVNTNYYKTAFGGDNSKYVDQYYNTHSFQKNNDP